MIKDSKLIGTKIAAPFGWKKFKVGELFVPSNPNRYALKISDVIDSKGTTVVVSSTTVNQGIKGYSSMEPLVTGGKIVYSDAVGPSMMFYQERDFIADAHVKYLKPRFTVNMSKNMALYLITCIQKSTFGVYSYGNKYNNDAVNNTIVELPVASSNQPDFEWMSAYMKAVKADYLEQKELSNQREIKDYLTAGKVDSMDVTADDRQFLRNFEKLPRRKFKVGDLFDFKSSMSLNKSDLKFVSKQDSFAIPYITRTVLNNGINGYVDSRLVGDEYINDGGEFAFGLLGLTAFYQCNRYCTGQFVKRFVPKFELNELLAMFFKTLLDKQIELFKTVSISSYTDLINDVLDIELPVIANDEVDVHSIEKYMQIQSKPLINKVAEILAPVGGGGHF